MPDVLSTTSILLLLVVVPGYLTVLWWARARTWRGFPSDIHTLLQSLALSMGLQLALSPFLLTAIYPVRDHLVDHPDLIIIWATLAVVVLPYVFGTGAAKLGDSIFPTGMRRPLVGWRSWVAWLVRPSPEPSVWDWLIPSGVLDGCFLVIQFKDGSTVAGTFAGDSVAATSPEQWGIYLAEEWVTDQAGNIYAQVPNSRGILIPDIREAKAIRIIGEKPKENA